MEKIDAKYLKLVQIRPSLCPCISGTKCDRHKLIFSAERGGCTYNRIDNHKKGGHHYGIFLACLRMGVPSSPMKGPCISKERLHNSLIQ